MHFGVYEKLRFAVEMIKQLDKDFYKKIIILCKKAVRPGWKAVSEVSRLY